MYYCTMNRRGRLSSGSIVLALVLKLLPTVAAFAAAAAAALNQ